MEKLEEKVETLPHICAVYGSLLTGMGNHSVIGRYIPIGGAKLLGECDTEELFSMINLHAYPGLLKIPKNKIHIEVYALSDRAFSSVRSLEGYNPRGGGLYTEHKTPTPFGNATIYIYNYADSNNNPVPADENNVVNWKTFKQNQYAKTIQ